MALGSDTKPAQKPKENDMKLAQIRGFPIKQA